MLAPYACKPEKSRGRLYTEHPTPYRNEFARDRDRIIHSNSFKRLQYKTQVFVNHEGDHYRNRLTHSIEVSTVARSIAKTLGLSDDLAESVSLAHDLGHSPFGHAGEESLNNCMKDYGGFSHNAHSLKLLTKLEQKYASYDGLNLTWEVLEGIVKHNGPLLTNIPQYIAEYNKTNNLELEHYSSAEAQIASLSDDIAYICHDIEDSLKAKIISFADLKEIEILDRYSTDLHKKYQNTEEQRIIYELARELMHHLINGLLSQTRSNFEQHSIKTESDIRLLKKQLIDFTDEVKNDIATIKQFLFKKVYRHYKVTTMTLRCQNIVRKLFELYMDNIDLLPTSWKNLILEAGSEKGKALIISDYIAGMTDRFAIKEYESLYNLNFSKIL